MTENEISKQVQILKGLKTVVLRTATHTYSANATYV